MKARSEKITSHYTATNDMTPLNRRFIHLSQKPAGNGTPSGHLWHTIFNILCFGTHEF